MLEPELLFEPILIAASFPAREVGLDNFVRERRFQGFKLPDNGWIGETVPEHLIDDVADGFGETSDVAISAGADLLRPGIGRFRSGEKRLHL